MKDNKRWWLLAITLLLLVVVLFQFFLLFSNLADATGAQGESATLPTAVAMVTRTKKPTFTPTAAITPTPVNTPTPTPRPTATATPTATPVPGQQAAIGEDLVNLRAGPGTDYAIIAQLTIGAELQVVGRSVENDWFFVQPEDGDSGWVFASYLTGLNDLEALAVVTPDPNILPLAEVSEELVNLRSGPGAEYEVLSQLSQGQMLAVVGRNEAGDWLAVKFGSDAGWIFGELVTYSGDSADLPVQTPPPTSTPLPATPTPKPVPLAAAVAPGQARVERKVLANYFAWYDGNGWDDCNISAGDKPLQPYHSDDPEAIARHIQMARNAGIDGFTLQWAGSGDRTDRNFATLLNKSQGTDFQSTVIFLAHYWSSVSQGDTIAAIRHLQSRYGGHPNFLHIQGRPVIFFEGVDRVPLAAGQNPRQAWASIRAQVDPGKQYWWIAEGLDPSYLAVFDGLWVYKVSHAAYPNDYVKASRWAGRVRSWEQKTGEPKLWVGTLMPGWDDRRARCRTDVRVPSQPFVRPREDGNFYRATYNAAVKSNPDILWIHSFNEWVEGTYIEPSQFYGDTYLNLTREFANSFKGG